LVTSSLEVVVKTLFKPFLALIVLALVAGCAGTKAAYREASAPPEVAFVVMEQYAATLKEAADLAPALPPQAQLRLKEADRIAKPFVLNLRLAASKYEAVQNAETEAELQNAINEAVFLIADFIRAVQEAAEG
jgi:hypothetical protein